jgi:hypothetical protein
MLNKELMTKEFDLRFIYMIHTYANNSTKKEKKHCFHISKKERKYSFHKSIPIKMK